MKRIIHWLFPSIQRRAEADARIERHQIRLEKWKNSRPNWDDEWAF